MQQLNDFFEIYAKALENYDTKGLAFLYNIPCTMLSDEATTSFSDAGRLEGFFNQGAFYYRQFGIAHVRHQIWNRRDVTGRVMNVKVNWQYYDMHQKPLYNCDYHYILKLDKNNHWKIVVSVSANEKERMEEWQMKIKSQLVNGLVS